MRARESLQRVVERAREGADRRVSVSLPGRRPADRLRSARWTAGASCSRSPRGWPGPPLAEGAGELGDAEPAADASAIRSRPTPWPRWPPPRPSSPPPTGVVDVLPGTGNSLALTIDDGTSSEVVGAFAALAVDDRHPADLLPQRLLPLLEDNAAVLRPLVESGQVALGNHTWSHPDLTGLGDREVAEEISRNRDFLRTVFGVRDSPFFRPPYGARDERTDRIAADLGHPTIAMWNGTLGDSRVLGPDELLASARQWFAAQAIVVGHANHPPVTTVYGRAARPDRRAPAAHGDPRRRLGDARPSASGERRPAAGSRASRARRDLRGRPDFREAVGGTSVRRPHPAHGTGGQT